MEVAAAVVGADGSVYAVISGGHLAPNLAVMTKPFEITAFGQKVRDMIDAKS